MIISFTGSHGTGKTTAVFKAAHRLKLRHPNKKIGTLAENASRCPYPINKEMTPEGQLWIFTSQIKDELSLIQQYDILVCDRTCVDAIAYTMVAGFTGLAEAMVQLALTHIHRYHTIIFKSTHQNQYLFRDGLRCVDDPLFRNRVETTLHSLYRRLGVDDGGKINFLYR